MYVLVIFLSLYLCGSAEAQATREGTNCSTKFMFDFDGPDGPAPPMEVTCASETPIYMDTTEGQFCFAANDPMVAACFITVDIKCSKTGYFSGCRKYYRCTQTGTNTFSKNTYECPMPKVYSEKYGACVESSLAPECSPWGGCPEKVGFHRDPQDCNKFYQCGLNATANATSMDPAIGPLECPDTMFFSVKEGDGTCVPYQQAEKCDFQVDPGTGTPTEEPACTKEGIMSDPAEAADADPKVMFIICFPIGGGKYGGIKDTCAKISDTAQFSKAIEGCFEPCA